VVYDARSKGGGLNEFGIAAYKSVDGFAQAEVEWLLQIGGIEMRYGQALGDHISLENLKVAHDAVFLGVGLGGVNALRAEGGNKDGVYDAVDFISELRQTDDLTALHVGRQVVVIGGGMTAIDAAVQSKLLGAQDVTVAYRRGRSAMGASQFEQDLATSKGVRIIFNAQPVKVHGNGSVTGVEFERTDSSGDDLRPTGETFIINADQVLKAIGQTLKMDAGLELVRGKIVVSADGKTSMDTVWAGGDCSLGGDDLTVTAVAEGRDAAMDIHATLMGKGHKDG
jgi:glutamate synthase (NADPH/NADH) small chain